MRRVIDKGTACQGTEVSDDSSEFKNPKIRQVNTFKKCYQENLNKQWKLLNILKQNL